MNKLILASALLAGLTGVAAAQQSQGFYGDHSAFVYNNQGSQAVTPRATYEVRGQSNATVPTNLPYNIHLNDNYSGK